MFRKLMRAVFFLGVIAGTVTVSATEVASNARVNGDGIVEAFKRDDWAAIETRFDAKMKQAAPHEKFVAMMGAIRQKFGALKNCAEPTVQQAGGITVFDYPCEFAQSRQTLRLAFNADATLGGLFFTPPKP